MIDRDTVFVLGAGASKPYLFPTGAELVDQIIEHLLGGSSRWSYLCSDDEDLNPAGFATRLRDSRLNSVDRFVERNPSYVDIAKRAIAQELIACEREERLFPVGTDRDRDWLGPLFNAILPRAAGDLRGCNLRIITFNFDRSFERALFLALSAIYTDTDPATLARHIPILHVHGQLCWPSWMRYDDRDVRPYDPTLATDIVKTCAANLLLAREELRPMAENAQEWLRNTKSVCFLGFGFDDANLDLLGIPHSILGKDVHCTTLGLSSGYVERVKARFRGPDSDYVKSWEIWYPGSMHIDEFLATTPIIHGR